MCCGRNSSTQSLVQEPGISRQGIAVWRCVSPTSAPSAVLQLKCMAVMGQAEVSYLLQHIASGYYWINNPTLLKQSSDQLIGTAWLEACLEPCSDTKGPQARGPLKGYLRKSLWVRAQRLCHLCIYTQHYYMRCNIHNDGVL